MTTRRQVLCVDDEPDITFRLKRFIERHYPIDVWTAENGYTALGMMSMHPFDAVLLDISMPGINGFEVTAQIIKSYPRTLVIIITASADNEVLSRSKGARFLVKPISMDDIKMLIYQHFDLLPQKPQEQ